MFTKLIDFIKDERCDPDWEKILTETSRQIKTKRLWWTSARRSSEGFIYVMWGWERYPDLFKIGSSVNPHMRKKQLMREVGSLYVLIALKTKNMRELEHNLHKTFEDKRVWREWFRLDPEDHEKILTYYKEYEGVGAQ